MKVNVDIVSDDNLSCKSYSFYANVDTARPTLTLNSFEEQTRPSTRHKFRVTGGNWNRLRKRVCNIEKPESIPSYVLDEAKRIFIEQITFKI
jgi:hypothetical protein